MSDADNRPGGLLQECGGQIKVVALTGIRSEYDLLFPLLRALSADAAFDLGVIVCGAHLTDLHHYSVRQIEADGLRIVERLETLLHSSSRLGKVKSSGLLLTALGQTLARERPDLLLVLGDREEVVVGSLAGLYLGIPVVHLAGGDSLHGGCPDEWVRHAATKMSHLHLVMAAAHAQRVVQMGEEPWRVHVVGSGGVDRLRQEPLLTRETLAATLGPQVLSAYAVLIFHPLMDAQCQQGGEQVAICLEGTLRAGLPLFVGAPNSDPGYQEVAKVVEAYAQRAEVTLYRHLPRSAFVALLHHARCLVGNSSLAFHEAPFLGLPAVNVGDRQRGRLASQAIQSVPLDIQAIQQAVHRAAFAADYRATVQPGDTLYGDGYMAERTVALFKNLPNKETLLAKRMTY
ncbi:MAG: UDP-N-acetylglucosamine 2-epimerase (hydrolyzing) [Magnetococcales bacterium]|nr:UDP-N-acetylglucosamine 2-epimerase (hydrolyzing) [Magnetococcales bacterium]